MVTHGHHHVIHVLRLWLIISSYRCCPTYKPPLVEHMREHSLFRATTQRMLVLPSILSHNSRNTPAFDPWDITQSLVDHADPKQAKHNVCFIKNCLALHTSRQAQKASTRATRRQSPLMLLFLQVSLGGTTLIAKRYTLQFSTGFVAIAWRLNTTTRRYNSTCAILVFKHPKQSKINPFTFHIYSPILNPC